MGAFISPPPHRGAPVAVRETDWQWRGAVRRTKRDRDEVVRGANAIARGPFPPNVYTSRTTRPFPPSLDVEERGNGACPGVASRGVEVPQTRRLWWGGRTLT